MIKCDCNILNSSIVFAISAIEQFCHMVLFNIVPALKYNSALCKLVSNFHKTYKSFNYNSTMLQPYIIEAKR